MATSPVAYVEVRWRPTPNLWELGAHYLYGELCSSDGNVYTCTSEITSSVTRPTGTNYGARTDGDGRWEFVQADFGPWSYQRVDPTTQRFEIQNIDKTCAYQIQARSVTERGTPSDWTAVEIDSAAMGSIAPGAPVNCSVIGVADGLWVSWTISGNTTPGGTMYLVQRALDQDYSVHPAEDSESWTQVAKVAGTSFTDAITDGTTWWYRVCAIDFNGVQSAWVYGSTKVKGKTVADGADNSLLNNPGTIQNPFFEAGDTGWYKGTGWTIQQDSNRLTGAWCAIKDSSSAASELFNAAFAPVQAYQRVTALAYVKGSTGVVAQFSVFVRWYNQSLGVISTDELTYTAVTTAYESKVLNTYAPSNAAFCRFGVYVSSHTAGLVYVDNTNMAIATDSLTQSEKDALTSITALSDDNKLTAFEKPVLYAQWKQIHDDKPVMDQDATDYSVSSLAYDNAWEALRAYIETSEPNGLGLIIGTNDQTWLRDVSAINCTGQTLRNLLAVFYVEEQALLTAISAAIDDKATTALSKFDEITADNKLSPAEKLVVYSAYRDLLDSHSHLIAEAMSAGVPNENYPTGYATFDSAINSLNTYFASTLGLVAFTNISPPHNGNHATPIWIDAAIATWLGGPTLDITGSTLRTIVATAYRERQFVLDLTSSKVRGQIIPAAQASAASAIATHQADIQAHAGLLAAKAAADMSNVTSAAITAQLSAGAIAAIKLAADVIGDGTNPATGFKAGAIGASAIAASSIDVSKLRVHDFGGAALNLDPAFGDTSAWGGPDAPSAPFDANNVLFQSLANGKYGNIGVSIRNNTPLVSRVLAYDPNKVYRIKVSARGNTAAAGAVRVMMFVMYIDASGNQITGTMANGSNSFLLYGVETQYFYLPIYAANLLTDTWKDLVGYVGPGPQTMVSTTGIQIHNHPAAGKYLRIGLVGQSVSNPDPNNYHDFQDFRIEECVNATLIVDGTIGANQIHAGAIQAQHLNIQNRIILRSQAGNNPDGTPAYPAKINGDLSYSLPTGNYNPGDNRFLADSDHYVAAADVAQTYEVCVDGTPESVGILFGLNSAFSPTTGLLIVYTLTGHMRLFAVSSLGSYTLCTAAGGYGESADFPIRAPLSGDRITVQWYNNPFQDINGLGSASGIATNKFIRCKVYLNGTMVAWWTAGQAASISRDTSVYGYGGVLLYSSNQRIRPDVIFGGPRVSIGDGTISTQQLVADSVDAVRLKAGAVTADKISAGAITADKIEADAIRTTNYNPAFDADGKEYASAGAKMQKNEVQGETAILVDQNSLRIGHTYLRDAWFSKIGALFGWVEVGRDSGGTFGIYWGGELSTAYLTYNSYVGQTVIGISFPKQQRGSAPANELQVVVVATPRFVPQMGIRDMHFHPYSLGGTWGEATGDVASFGLYTSDNNGTTYRNVDEFQNGHHARFDVMVYAYRIPGAGFLL